MTDVLTAAQRHVNMSHIRGKETSIEIKVRKKLFSLGFRYRKNVSDLPGKPDIVIHKYKAAIFIHGCFWHRHPNCKYTTTPSTNNEFWLTKFQNTIKRDEYEQQKLVDMGWHVYVIWECQIKYNFDATIKKLISNITS